MTERVMDLLPVFNLQEHAEFKAKNLPHNQQRKFEIAHVLAASPKVLLLGKPTAGMNPTEVRELMKSIQLIRDRFSISILLIKHNTSFVAGICQHLVVLDYDRVIVGDSTEETRANLGMIAACLEGEWSGSNTFYAGSGYKLWFDPGNQRDSL